MIYDNKTNIDDSEITTFIHYWTTILNIFWVMEILILCIMGFFFVLTSNRTEKENYILNSLDKMLIILSFFIIGGNFIFIFYA